MEIQALRRRDQLLVGFTLFSMFFGAGNLIFPPQLGAQAGVDTWFAMAGLAVSAVFLPILGVLAVVRAGSLTELASRVHPAFATVFTVLIYLSIGPCLAIPRTASTSFEMAVPPFLPSGTPTMWFQFGYSLLFFAAAFLVALQPEKLTGRLGKFLCPMLLLLVGAMFVGSLVHPVGTYGPTLPPYDQIPAVQGFLTGYQTMDTIAALNFGIVIVMNIRALGVTDQGSVLRATVRAGGIATVLFLAVYSMLAHIGALSGAAFPGMTNGAVTLTNLVGAIFGHWGTVILAAIFFIACFNTCVGLISSCSAYFHTLVPRVPAPAWAAFFALLSMVISNAGLDQILKISVPILNILYPPAIVLILLSFLPQCIQRFSAIYPVGIAFTSAASILYAARDLGLSIPALDRILKAVPLSGMGLGWVLPALAGVLLGVLLSVTLPSKGKD